MHHHHQLLDHPFFEEQPFNDVLEPFGFETSIKLVNPPIDPECDDPAAIDAYASDPQAYIDGLTFSHPAGFTEVDRSENDEGDIYSVAVRAKTVFAQLLLCADSPFAGSSSNCNRSYIDVYHERMRQISTEGFSREHDDKYTGAELSRAALAYANIAALQGRFGITEGADLSQYGMHDWPWAKSWWKPSCGARRNLVKAGALILAEIERLDRAAAKLSEGEIPVGASDVGGAQ